MGKREPTDSPPDMPHRPLLRVEGAEGAEVQATEERRAAYLMNIRSYCNLLPEAELLVISQVCQRMTQGFLEYGELDLNEERDWQKELREELVDALVYDAITQIRGSGAE